MPVNSLPLVTAAFDADGYDVDAHVFKNGKLGVRAKHRTATINGDPQQKKKAFYLEGSHEEMGYLLGRLAEEDISRMTTSFVNQMIWDLIFWHPRISVDPPDPTEQTLINLIKSNVGAVLGDFIGLFSANIAGDIPDVYHQEIDGLLQGCRDANPQTRVIKDHLWVLNFGIDWFLANVYSGLRRFAFLRSAILNGLVGLNPPSMCNGFSLFGDAARGGHYFGRDFMFPTAGVFEKTACMIVYKPDAVLGQERFPFVSVTAPGMLGCVSGMNRQGVGIGIEILPAAAADPDHPGFNSLVLNRHCIEKAGSAEGAKDVIVNAKRGVPWIYVISDGTNDRACAVEAVNSRGVIPFADFPPQDLLKGGCLFGRPLLPSQDFLTAHPTAVQENGVMVRWEDYSYDQGYLAYNKRLFKRFNKTPYPDAFDERGFINRGFTEENCPHMYYFAPQREARKDMVLTTNHFIIPEMRYTCMDLWLRLIFGKLVQDSQWRYDALNDMILGAIDTAGQSGQNGVDYPKAKEILDFINPITGRYRDYYGPNKHVIEGAQSLFDLKNMTVESHYGYYGDEWIKISLKNYVP
jgi:hypothetical protein